MIFNIKNIFLYKKLFSNIWHSFSYVRRTVSNIRKWLILENTDFCPKWLAISFVSFRFDLFRFVLFRFVSICFVSFRSVSFRFDLFRFVSICFVSFLFRFALYRDPKLNLRSDSQRRRHFVGFFNIIKKIVMPRKIKLISWNSPKFNSN